MNNEDSVELNLGQRWEYKIRRFHYADSLCYTNSWLGKKLTEILGDGCNVMMHHYVA